ncbi:MAG: hypothetical protein QOH31_6500 [Verrucomicrobiota bacterium]
MRRDVAQALIAERSGERHSAWKIWCCKVKKKRLSSTAAHDLKPRRMDCPSIRNCVGRLDVQLPAGSTCYIPFVIFHHVTRGRAPCPEGQSHPLFKRALTVEPILSVRTVVHQLSLIYASTSRHPSCIAISHTASEALRNGERT